MEELNLSHMKIGQITNLHPFVSLRKLTLLDNDITEISGLENCRVLEELSLEKNMIASISNLHNLRYLKKLDLGSNKIKRISNVGDLANLTQLSLENNEISRLDGLEELQYLMELYMGNNLIADVKETIKLQDLSRLIILDISGNPMSSGTGNNLNYRIYCIYHLRKLRVLDGVSIDPREHMEAKETFSGRLTDELLHTRIGNQKMGDIRLLDLSNCKLRDFEDMFDCAKFPAVREINLSGNLMASLRCIGNLPTLRILRLKQNRLLTLFCKPAPEDKNFKRGLFGVPNLEFLDVSGNCLQYLYGLQFSPLKELRYFSAANNEIVKIEHLEKLKQLRELDLSKNKIRQIDQGSFHPWHQIQSLRLDENAIKSVNGIEKLEHVQILSMQSNRINEYSELERIGELVNLAELNLLSNPMSRKQNYKVVVLKRMPGLVTLDGRDITIAERQRIGESAGTVIDPKVAATPMVHFAQYPQQYPGA